MQAGRIALKGEPPMACAWQGVATAFLPLEFVSAQRNSRSRDHDFYLAMERSLSILLLPEFDGIAYDKPATSTSRGNARPNKEAALTPGFSLQYGVVP